MEKSLCNINVGNEVYFLSTSIPGASTNQDFSIGVTLIEGSSLKAWTGTFGDIKENAKRIDLDEQELIDLTCKGLTRQNMGAISFEYQIISLKNNVELSWKKVVSSVKFQIGKVMLEAVSSPPEAIKDILLHSIQTITDLKDSIYRLESEKDRISNERTQALKRLEKCVVQKEQIESDLYGKFAVILNEKKAKIRELKDRPSAESVQIDNGDEGSNLRDEERKEGMKEEGDEAMDMEDDDTDEERQREESFRKRKKRTAALTQSKTKQTDDSSMFDDEQPEEATTTRRRKREPTSRKTASSQKTAIPRVPSGGTPSTSRTPSRAPSLRKTPSREKSQRETDNVDDLLDEF